MLANNNKTPAKCRVYQSCADSDVFAAPLSQKTNRLQSSCRSCGAALKYTVLKELMENSQVIIAVVDDEPELRGSLATLIAAYGYGVQTFDSAETFLVCASTCLARCLLVDIQLGDLSGVELARQLAADGFKFPIIFMSGNDDPTIETQVMAAGGIAFLRKPFSAKMLFDAIKSAVKAD